MNTTNSHDFDDLLEELCPGYGKMSFDRQESIQWKYTDVIRYSKQIKALIAEMKDQESPLYQANASDKELIEIASIYSKICETSKTIRMPTGNVVRGGPYYDTPEDEFKIVEQTETERESSIRAAVERHNATKPVKAKNVLNRLMSKKSPSINFNTALEAKKVLDDLGQVHTLSEQENTTSQELNNNAEGR